MTLTGIILGSHGNYLKYSYTASGTGSHDSIYSLLNHYIADYLMEQRGTEAKDALP